MQSAADLVNNLGFPVALVLILLLFLWRACRYMAPLGRRVVEQHLDFLEHTKEHTAQQTVNLVRQTELIELINETEGQHSQALLHLSSAAESTIDGEKDEARQFLKRMRNSVEKNDSDPVQ